MEKVVLKLYKKLGLNPDNIIDDHDTDLLKIETGESGRDILWYYDGIKNGAIYMDDLTFLSLETIEKELY